MKAITRPRLMPLLALAVLLGAASASVAAPGAGGEGKDNGQKQERKARASVDDRAGRGSAAGGAEVRTGGKMGRKPLQPGAYFNDRSREAVATYYAGRGGKGACPPGLAKKNNGCMPPGQANKPWQIGEPLPATVVLAPVPQQIVVKLPPVPRGHRYVEVAGDIVLIAVGSRMVIDGINGLMR